ncbi:hypothetical protein NDU88_006453 [Pleurodeles waltl]|uniref:Uncharacterized protein n=1 Tax=Pleurodeles waltl TaxID=8319 RepID=A0AAV7UM61_PLEWA|nr:hypothetical protein NDU88_006453 [Pleurodeles waltl]
MHSPPCNNLQPKLGTCRTGAVCPPWPDRRTPAFIGKKPLTLHARGQGKHTGTSKGIPGDVRVNALDAPPTGQGKQGTTTAQQERRHPCSQQERRPAQKQTGKRRSMQDLQQPAKQAIAQQSVAPKQV